MRKLISLLALLSTLLILSACSSKAIRMYTLAPAEVPTAASTFRHASVRVDYPKGIEDTMGTRIYFSRSDLTRSYYRYNQWSISLNRIVMAHLIETLQRSRIFGTVLDYASEADSDYTLETTIYRFQHRIEKERSYADVSIGLRLLRSSDNRLVKSRRFNYLIPAETTDAPGFVEAANRAMQRLSADMVRWLGR